MRRRETEISVTRLDKRRKKAYKHRKEVMALLLDQTFKDDVLRFIHTNYMGLPGRYRYSAVSGEATLYASTYAAMTMSLFGKDIPDREEWAAYLCSYQEADGLFRDPVIWGEGWYKNDALWCGRTHLTSHILIALTCLGAVAPRENTFLSPWEDTDYMVSWLESRLWNCKGDISQTGNEIMNVGGLLQYERDFHGNDRAGRAVATMLEWLSCHHIDPATGLWGDDVDLRDPLQLSGLVQAAYHWWELFFYDGVPIPYAAQAAESILMTQNPLGGFGLGVHNRKDPFLSSACEDIDSMSPLARLYRLGIVKNDTVKEALLKGAQWVKSNQTPDGGLQFIKNRRFDYGHPQLAGPEDQGAMFPTWFRCLTLALTARAFGDESLHFVRCPGMQFDVG